MIKLRYYEKGEGVHVRSAYAVIALDPSTATFCPECRGPLRVIVRVDGGGIPPPDGGRPEGEQYPHDDAADWTYHRPRGEHAGMGMPNYGEDGSLLWDKGVPNMPADYQRLHPEYRRCLRWSAYYRTVRYAIAAMRRQNPNVNRGAATRAVRRCLSRAGLPDKAQDGWERTCGPMSGGSTRVWRGALRAGTRPAGTGRGTDIWYGRAPAPSGPVPPGRAGPP